MSRPRPPIDIQAWYVRDINSNRRVAGLAVPAVGRGAFSADAGVVGVGMARSMVVAVGVGLGDPLDGCV